MSQGHSSFSSKAFMLVILALSTVSAYAAIGDMAGLLNDQLTNVANLIGSIGYVAGMGFGVASVFKFKQHRDSPTQVPIGTPFAMLAVAVALVYLPSLITEAGSSAFSDGQISGATGTSYADLGGE